MKIGSVSEHIAPEMVAIDDHNNGWRQLVLPLAWVNDMVLNSVTAVAAFHMSEGAATSHQPTKRGVPTLADPAILYSKAILELQKRRDLHNSHLDARHQVIVAIMVLLLATMVNGSSDFSIIFHMLQSAVGFVGGEEALAASGNDLTDFLSIQIRKYDSVQSPFSGPRSFPANRAPQNARLRIALHQPRRGRPRHRDAGAPWLGLSSRPLPPA